jgi:hypothetical protein
VLQKQESNLLSGLKALWHKFPEGWQLSNRPQKANRRVEEIPLEGEAKSLRAEADSALTTGQSALRDVRTLDDALPHLEKVRELEAFRHEADEMVAHDPIYQPLPES